MSCGSKTSVFPDIHHCFETAEAQPWHRRVSHIFRFATAHRWQFWLEFEKTRQRRQLNDLDDHLLADIGKTHAQANREARKRFWR